MFHCTLPKQTQFERFTCDISRVKRMAWNIAFIPLTLFVLTTSFFINKSRTWLVFAGAAKSCCENMFVMYTFLRSIDEERFLYINRKKRKLIILHILVCGHISKIKLFLEFFIQTNNYFIFLENKRSGTTVSIHNKVIINHVIFCSLVSSHDDCKVSMT